MRSLTQAEILQLFPHKIVKLRIDFSMNSVEHSAFEK